jgi:hypothetical protein
MYFAYINQTDAGCDHTIACGKVIVKLKAQNREQAIAELKRDILGEYFPEDNEFDDRRWGENLQSVLLLEVIDHEYLPLASWYQEAKRMVAQAQDDKDKADRRAQYEELKKEFESA